MFDTNHNDGLGRVKELLPKVNRVIFDGHDRIQDSAIRDMHTDLNRVDQSVERLVHIAESTTTDLSKVAKAMKAVNDATLPKHAIADGPVPATGGLPDIDPATALPAIGDLAKARAEAPKDAGVSRVAAK